MTDLSPKDIVARLDRHIIGQADAKRAVAIALRNRWRRMQLPDDLAKEVTPKNILMIGPTGVGKTEIARRLAHLAQAPFIKIEATKFTEVGYVGRESNPLSETYPVSQLKMNVNVECSPSVIKQRIARKSEFWIFCYHGVINPSNQIPAVHDKCFGKSSGKFDLDDKEVEIDVKAGGVGVDIMTPLAWKRWRVSSKICSLNSGRTRRSANYDWRRI